MSSSLDSLSSNKISIGLPVYNGELFIKKSIDSILSQSHSNFELIISDNASTDKTSQICQEYVKRDNRIIYFKQPRNIGPHRNYFFLLNKANHGYFIYVAADDFLDSNYIEENLKILISDPNIVSSVGKVKPYGTNEIQINSVLIDTVQYPKFIKNYIKSNRRKKMLDTESVTGTYENKVRHFLKITKSLRRWYGLHRTEQLKKCIIDKPFINNEVSVFLNLLKFGDFFECKDTALHEFDEGISSRGILNTIKISEHNFFGTIFPFYPFTKWCFDNFGYKLFLKNFDIFFLMSCSGTFGLFVDLFLKFKSKL